MRNLMWFRADLRIHDNVALAAASAQSDELLAIFIITPKTWQRHDASAIKIEFILANLRSLKTSLAGQGIPLLIRETDYFSECPHILQKLCYELNINAIYFNRQYEIDELRRDKKVSLLLNHEKIKIFSYDDQLILAPGAVLSQQKAPLKVFTPFKKTWLAETEKTGAWMPNKIKAKQFTSSIKGELIPKKIAGFDHELNLQQWPAGEEHAVKQIKNFCETHLLAYQIQRDFPLLEATSQLSPYLAQGVISPRQCVQALMQQLELTSFSHIQQYAGAATWLSELIWREFYKHIMYFFPAVNQHQPFKEETNKLVWRDNKEDFNAWCKGKTGFPFIDAAMRQLHQIGWMHNRLRMVVAMFFTKTLLLDWRWGEKYFMKNLIDGDLAANNGGWQWSASTGTDAVPYFRIFNPITQSERFDADGKFIRRYCSELAHLDNKSIHNPSHYGIKFDTLDYPQPIADYAKRRAKAIKMFKDLK